MIDLRPAIRTILLSDPAITAVVGASPNDRIYPGVLPQGETRPSIVYNQISEFLTYHMQGGTNQMSARMQINAWAASQAASVALAGLVFDKLSGYKGIVSYGGSPAVSVDIQGVFHDNGADETDTASNPFRYSRRRDYIFWYVYG